MLTPSINIADMPTFELEKEEEAERERKKLLAQAARYREEEARQMVEEAKEATRQQEELKRRQEAERAEKRSAADRLNEPKSKEARKDDRSSRLSDFEVFLVPFITRILFCRISFLVYLLCVYPRFIL